MGQVGTLGRIRMFGPAAQAITGLSEMSGLPAPYPPAGIGYSYLDWYGAYNMAAAMMAALYRQTHDREGLSHRLLPGRARPLALGDGGIGLLGQRSRHWSPLRQPVAVQTGRASWRLPSEGQRPVDRDYLF
jgi:hypothetical protein